MQVSEALVLVAGVLLIQASGMPTSTEPRKKHKPEDTSISQVRFVKPADKFLQVALNGEASINCQVEDSDGVEFHLFNSPSLTQTALERTVQANKFVLSNGVYTLRNVEALDYGHYYCTAKKDDTNIRKNFTIVPLQERVTSVITPQDANVNYRGDQSMSCTCWSQDCQVTMRASPVRGEEEPEYESETTRSSLYRKTERIMKLANVSSTLTVECTAKRGQETATSSVTVFVTGKRPEFHGLMEKVELQDGSVEIKCEASGPGLILIWWTHEGEVIQDCGSQCQTANYQILGEKLKILRVNEKTVGKYGCIATNDFGMTGERYVTIEPLESKP